MMNNCIIWKEYGLTCVHDISLYCIRYLYAVPTFHGILGCILGFSPTLGVKMGVFLGMRYNERFV